MSDGRSLPGRRNILTEVGMDVFHELRWAADRGKRPDLTTVQLGRLTGHRRANVRWACLGLEAKGLVHRVVEKRGHETFALSEEGAP